MTGKEVLNKRRRIAKIKYHGAAGGDGNQHPAHVSGDDLPDLVKSPRRLGQPHALIAVTLDQAFDPNEKIRPYGLGAGVAAPNAAKEGGHEEESHRGENQKACYVDAINGRGYI